MLNARSEVTIAAVANSDFYSGFLEEVNKGCTSDGRLYNNVKVSAVEFDQEHDYFYPGESGRVFVTLTNRHETKSLEKVSIGAEVTTTVGCASFARAFGVDCRVDPIDDISRVGLFPGQTRTIAIDFVVPKVSFAVFFHLYSAKFWQTGLPAFLAEQRRTFQTGFSDVVGFLVQRTDGNILQGWW